MQIQASLPQQNTQEPAGRASFAWYGWAGLGLLAVSWALNWTLDGLRTYWCYIPLWWGLALTIDALCLRFRGTSMLHRSRGSYARLAILSIPAWLVFEVFNQYVARDWLFSSGNLFLQYPQGVLGALALSAVMPVIFGSAELISALPGRRWEGHRPFRLDGRANLAIFLVGSALLAAVLIWPHHLFALIWLALTFLFEAANIRLGRPSLLLSAARGDWGPALHLGFGGLVAGFFSELWNYYSLPKWYYDVPFWNVYHIFELPLVGYLVFLTVGWELYALYQLVFPAGPLFIQPLEPANIER
jgi:hypothetical protein